MSDSEIGEQRAVGAFVCASMPPHKQLEKYDPRRYALAVLAVARAFAGGSV